MPPDVDLAVLGGGCAGLSLGLRLAERRDATRTMILETRDGYADDRTWCFWAPRAHRFTDLVRQSWPVVTLSDGVRTVRAACGDTPYQMVPSGAFYAHATAAIASSDRVALRMSTLVGPVRRAGGLWVIETSCGPLTAARVLDTRPPRPPARDAAILWQSFAGQEVETAAAAFDPACVTLMDFAPSADAVWFTYVLPLSRARALIETTVFGPDPLPAAALAAAQDSAVARLCPSVTVVRAEHGILPMGLHAADPSLRLPSGPGYHRAGLMSGAARPSTGYAFQRIQRWAEAAAAGGPLGHPPDPWVARAMDRLFLRVVRRDPARAPGLFLRMFAGDPARVIRFLSDRASIADRAAVAWSLPKLPFLRGLLA